MSETPPLDPTRLALERRALHTLTLVTLIAALSGFATHLSETLGSDAGGVWRQITYLLHTLFGVALVLALPLYLLRHIRRVLSRRRLIAIGTGLVLTLSTLWLAGSGLQVTLFGQQEALRGLYQWHIVGGYLLAPLLVLHLLFHRLPPMDQRSPWLTLPWAFNRVSLLALLGVLLFGYGATRLYEAQPSPFVDAPQVADYQYSYGDSPFYPSQARLAKGEFIDPRRLGNSQECATCHADIYRQWQASVHALAAKDPAYVTNVNLLEKSRGTDATRYCEGCHAPVALLSGELTPGGKHGGVPGTLANREGVGCLGCHAIRGAVHLNGVGSYEVATPSAYLFEGWPGRTAQLLRNFLISIHPQEHRAEVSYPISRSAELCATCHEQYMAPEMNHWGWVKMQNDYSSWLASPFSGLNESRFSHPQRQDCKACHMPTRPGSDPSANAAGQVVDHRAPGANRLLATLSGDAEQEAAVLRMLQQDKLRIAIDRPLRQDANRSGQFVDEQLRSAHDTPSYFYLGEEATIQLSVSNNLVGHNFPGGTTDINEAWVDFRVQDAEGRRLFRSGELEVDGRVDPAAVFYRSIPVDRQGRAVWRHDLFRVTGDMEKRVIPSGGSDVVEYHFPIPYWAKSPITLHATLRYRKLNPRYAAWALGELDHEQPITDLAEDHSVIPLRERAPVVTPGQ